MFYFDTTEKEILITKGPGNAYYRLTESFHLHNAFFRSLLSPLHHPKDRRAKISAKQKKLYPEVLLQQIIQLSSDPSLDISLRDISQKLTELVNEKKFKKQHLLQFSLLTTREKEVLLRLARGLTNRQVADQLCISLETVKHHRKIIKSKLEAGTTADFIRYVSAFKLEEPTV